MELLTATGKLEKFFLTTRDVWCVHHGWHASNISSCQKRTFSVSCGCE